MKKMLITGFDPFGGEHCNPAWEAVRRLPNELGAFTLEKLEIPTVYTEAAEAVLRGAAQCHPDVILCIGQAGGRNALTPELIAVNHRHAASPDNRGTVIREAAILDGAPVAYLSTLPVYRMADAANDKNVPTRVSYSAGTFVCNDTLYRLLHHFCDTGTRVGFVHVPYLPVQTEGKPGVPSMSLDEMITGIAAMIAALG